MNAARWFQRREDYQLRQTPPDSRFRKFDVKCLACGSYQLWLVLAADEIKEIAVVRKVQEIWGGETPGSHGADSQGYLHDKIPLCRRQSELCGLKQSASHW